MKIHQIESNIKTPGKEVSHTCVSNSNDTALKALILYIAPMILLTLVAFIPQKALAQYGLEQCEDTCAHIHGIDISHYQGDVFWEAIGDNSKMAYVYIKATEGGGHIDTRYESNINLAHRYGLKVGSYHFFRPTVSIETQIENFTTQCRPSEQDLIPLVDVETTGGLTTDQLCDSLDKMLIYMERAYKQKPMIYSGANFYNKHLAGKYDDYLLMIAQYKPYPPVLVDGRDYIIWQYTGKGRINGINTFVDKSMFMGRHSLREIRFRRKQQ